MSRKMKNAKQKLQNENGGKAPMEWARQLSGTNIGP